MIKEVIKYHDVTLQEFENSYFKSKIDLAAKEKLNDYINVEKAKQYLKDNIVGREPDGYETHQVYQMFGIGVRVFDPTQFGIKIYDNKTFENEFGNLTISELVDKEFLKLKEEYDSGQKESNTKKNK